MPVYWEFVLISFTFFFARYTFVGAVFCSEKEAYLTHIKALDSGISKRAHSSLLVNMIMSIQSSNFVLVTSMLPNCETSIANSLVDYALFIH